MLRRLAFASLLVLALAVLGCGDGGSVHLDTFGPDTSVPQDPGIPEDPGVTDTVDDTRPPTDEGQPPTDEGQPPTDEGQPPTDEGQPPTDEGQPPTDEGQPTDEGLPPEDTIESDTFEETVEPTCVEDEDCADFGEPAQCHEFICEEGECVEAPVPNDDPCSDGDLCTAPDTCQDGFCVPGAAVVCDDDDPCTVDSCGEMGCEFVPNETVLTCGTGDCHREVPFCTDGVPNTCEPGMPGDEVCDGLDNDCDGEIDNGNPGAGIVCESELSGPCKPGTTACVEGVLICVPNVPPEPEICDGLDNDCDGEIDNGNPGGGASCRTGKLGVCGVGAIYCVDGLLECIQTVQPTAEVCDGKDNNCDGQVDENNPGAGLPCDTGKPGVCAEGITTCTEGKAGCVQVGQPSEEVCDGKDNDCDGVVDPANAVGCSVFYKDADGDGYGIAGDSQCLCVATEPYTGTQTGDCCDTDERARPSATAWFTSVNNCGSFDFNCDGVLSQQYTVTGKCRYFDFPFNLCETDAGWIGSTPNCGIRGDYLTNCRLDWFQCRQETTKTVQGCR